jgi:actin related protein 2/3 complex subunit 4
LQKQELVNFIIQFMQDVNAEVSELKLAVNSRARVVAHTFLKQFC